MSFDKPEFFLRDATAKARFSFGLQAMVAGITTIAIVMATQTPFIVYLYLVLPNTGMSLGIAKRAVIPWLQLTAAELWGKDRLSLQT